MTLQARNLQLARIQSGEETYGTGSAVEQASKFYYDKVLPRISTAIKTASAPLRAHIGKVDLLVSMLGFSPETVILTASALEPSRVLALYSENAVGSVETVKRFLDDHVECVFDTCHPTSPAIIANIVEDAARRLSCDQVVDTVVVDITGGKKLMSAAAIVGAIRCRHYISYIEGDYDPSIRRPRPGTEQLLVFDYTLEPLNPIPPGGE